LFCAISGAGFRAVKVFQKILPGACTGVEIFLKTACGLTFTARQEAVNTFAQEQ
jgi:hypothetical protein